MRPGRPVPLNLRKQIPLDIVDRAMDECLVHGQSAGLGSHRQYPGSGQWEVARDVGVKRI